MPGCDRALPPPAPGADAQGSAGPRPEAIEAALLAAGEYFSRDELGSAEAILVRLIEQAPNEHRAHELYGSVLYVRAIRAQAGGDEPGAAALLRRAYEQYAIAVETAGEADPETAAGLQQSAGEIGSAAGRTQEALDHFRAAGRLAPLVAKHPLYEGQILLQLDRLPEAAGALRRALELDPDEAFAHASLAEVAIRQGDGESAVRHVVDARRLDPSSLALRVAESRIRRRSGQPRQALELLLALDPRTRAVAPVTAEIAACYEAMGDPAGSAAAWEDRYRRHPVDWRAGIAAARRRLDAGQPDAAWALFHSASRAAPGSPEVRALEEALREEKIHQE